MEKRVRLAERIAHVEEIYIEVAMRVVPRDKAGVDRERVREMLTRE